MKFIGGIQTFQFRPNGIMVRMPSYHRSSTGLFPKTTVYLYPRKTNKGKVREIVVSPFHPMNWAYIWKLELNSIDRPGLIKDITKILRDERVNIFIQESLITNYNEDFTVSLIAHFHDYFEKRGIQIKNKLDSEQLKVLHNEISSIFKNVRDTEETNEIEVERFEQIKFLINNSKEVIMNLSGATSENRVNIVHRDRLNHYYQTGYHGTKIENKGVLIENRLLVDLDLREYAGDADSIQGTLFSDTEEKFIIVRFFSKDQLVVNIEITHENLFGAINAFTEKISNIDKDYNIISCYNRIEDDQNTALWYVLVDVTSNPDRVQTLIDDLRKIRRPQVDQVKVISYSQSLSEEAKRKNLGLEVSDEQLALNSQKVSADEKQLELLRDLLDKSNLAVESLRKEERQIQVKVDKEISYTLLFMESMIVLGLLLIIGLTLMVQWDILDPWVSIAPYIIAGVTTLYSVIRGIEFRLPKNDEKTRRKIESKWTSNLGYELEGNNSLSSKISVLNREIEEYTNAIRGLETKLLK